MRIFSPLNSHRVLITITRRIDGSPNFRRVPLTLRPSASVSTTAHGVEKFVVADNGKMVCGR